MTTTIISDALLALFAPPTTITGAFGALCSRCNKDYETATWEGPWVCPDCVKGEMAILRRSQMWPGPLTPLVIDGWGAGS